MKTFLLAMFLPLTASAQGVLNLQPGQSVLALDYYSRVPVTVVCQQGGYPPIPIPPPQPVCNAYSVGERVNNVLARAQRAASGYCVREYNVRHCGDKLQGDPQLADTQQALRNNLSSIKREVNQVCEQRICARYEEEKLIKSYNRTLEDISRLVHRNPDNGQTTRSLLTDSDVRSLRLDRCGW